MLQDAPLSLSCASPLMCFEPNLIRNGLQGVAEQWCVTFPDSSTTLLFCTWHLHYHHCWLPNDMCSARIHSLWVEPSSIPLSWEYEILCILSVCLVLPFLFLFFFTSTYSELLGYCAFYVIIEGSHPAAVFALFAPCLFVWNCIRTNCNCQCVVSDLAERWNAQSIPMLFMEG